MSAKTFIIIILSIFILFTVFIIALMGIYKYNRTWLGFPPDSSKIQFIDKKKTPIKNNLQLSSSTNKGVETNTYLENDTLMKIKTKLTDSIVQVGKSLAFLSDSLSKVNKNLYNTLKVNKSLQDSLAILNFQLKKSSDELALAKQKAKTEESLISKKKDSLELQNLTNFAKIYNNSKPAEVARILEKIDERSAARILKLMDQKKAGKIIEVMSPKNAASILLLGGSK
jgi:flagellar motility protein MotE (MotC chaperone)